MTKKNTNRTKNAYEARRKKMIAIVCIILAGIFLIWTIAGSIMVFAEETEEGGPYAAVSAQSAASANSEMRGMWVATTANLDYPTKPTTSAAALKAEADTIINDCYDMGMNAIFFQVRPAADALYQSAYYPWSRYLTGTQGTAPADGFDPLAYWVEKAHAKGIELHAWINPFRITQANNDWSLLSWNNPAKGAYNDYVMSCSGKYYFNPGEPAVRDLITDAAVEIVRNYDVDGIHFDDYFYPDGSFDDSATYAAYGAGMGKAQWRRSNIDKLIRQVNDAVHAADDQCVFGVSPMGIWANSGTSAFGSATRGGESYSQRYADSYNWVKNGWVDYIAPQIYWNIGYSVADYRILANWWADVVKGTGVDLYIGIADYRANATSGAWKGTDELVRQLQLNDTIPEIRGEIHFRYKSCAGSTSIFNLYKNAYASNRVSANTNPRDAQTSSGLYDISGHWAVSYIEKLVSENIINGIGDGTFRPNAPVTRAQFVKMLALQAGADLSSPGEITFTDVPEGSWFTPSIKWAARVGIVSGRSRTIFAPDENITRQEMAVMLSNYCDFFGITCEDETEQIRFPDSSEISKWAADSVDKIIALGIMNGVLDDNVVYFYPFHNTTRAEAAKVVCGMSALMSR